MMGYVKNKRLFIIALSAAVVAAVWLWSSRLLDTGSKAEANVPEYTARLFEPPIPIQSFSLSDHNGKPFNTITLLGYWTFVFFGYTNCPDVCPIALVDLNKIYNELERGFNLGNTKVAFVSVDKKRDSLEHLAEYVTYFNPNFMGITGEEEQVKDFAGQFGAVYKTVYQEGKSKDDYLVDHTASIMLVDHLGRLIAVFPPPHNTDFIKAEFIRLRTKYGEGYGCLTGY